jgi:23S rRNA (uracil1939-C5)-methyltransferase
MTQTQALSCPIQTKCGGCPVMDQPAEEAKTRRLSWISRALNHPVTDWVESPQRMGYRARLRLSTDGSGGLGFHPPRSAQVLPIDACPVGHTALAPALSNLRPVPSGVAHLELRTDGSRVVAGFEAHNGGHGDVRAWLQSLDEAAFAGADIALDGKRIRGSCHVEITAGGITHHLSPDTFYQVNLPINELLVDHVRTLVLERSPSHVLDAFAGAGNLSMPLAQAGVALTQLEQHSSAVRDAKATAKRHNLSLSTLQSSAQRFSAGDVFFDLAIIDPPRAGMGKMMPQLLLTRPACLILISCNPPTLARDIRPAIAEGYRITHTRAYEMFPQTEHAEVLVVLER